MMRYQLIILLALLFAGNGIQAQRLMDRSGYARFYSEAPLENIEAINKQALGAIQLGSGEVATSMLMKGFRFEKALMEEHFNENYIESSKYPKATFSGQIEDFSKEELSQKGDFTKTVNGEITIHGVTKPLTADVDFSVGNDKIDVESVFMLTVADFDIEIPMSVVQNIAEEVEVTVKFSFDKP